MRTIDFERMNAWLDELRPVGVALDDKQCTKMVQLDSLLMKWNRTAGLIGFRSDKERFDRYFGEALHGSIWLPERGWVVDVGTGGGCPALPMAIHCPELQWTLVEPNYKKALFLREAVTILGLDNITVERSRLLNFQPFEGVRIVTTRGLAMTEGSIQAIGGWLAPGGRFFIFSGQKAAERIAEFSKGDWTIDVRERLAPRFQAVLLILQRV